MFRTKSYMSGAKCVALASALIAALFVTAKPALSKDAHKAIYPANAKPIAPYSPGILVKDGTLYVSGNIAYVKGAIPAHAVDGKNDMEDQAKIVMENIRAILDEAGYTFDDAVKVSVFMTDIANYGAFNKVYGTYWSGGETPPAREAVQVAGLPGAKPGAPVLVEVSMIAQK